MTARFPGFSSVAQAQHWDEATRRSVLARLDPPGALRFFDDAQGGAVARLAADLVGVPLPVGVRLAAAIDSRLAEHRTDGWHYDDMPEDGGAWRQGIAALDEEAGGRFSAADEATRHAVLEGLRTRSGAWHGMSADRLWSLWMRYTCYAYYALPEAWDELGWAGPAYPRGYKNLGVDAREPFEVRDHGETR